MGQLEHIDVTHRHLLLEGLPGIAIVEDRLSTLQDVRPESAVVLLTPVGLGEVVLDLGLRGTIEHRGGEVLPERFAGPAQMCLKTLTHVHAGRHTERIENDLDGSSVGKIGHIFFGNDPGDDTLVAMPPGHLVAYRELALHGHVDLDHLDDAGRQLVALLQSIHSLVEESLEHLDLAFGLVLDLLDLVQNLGGNIRFQQAEVGRPQLPQDVPGELGFLLKEFFAGPRVHQILFQGATGETLHHSLVSLFFENANLIVEVLLQHAHFFGLDRLGPLVFLHTLAGKDLHVHDDSFDAGWTTERCVPNIAGFLAEDGAQQLFLRGELSFTFGGHLAHQDVAGLHIGADPDDAGLVQIRQKPFGHIGNIASDLLRPELGVSSLGVELLDMDRSVSVRLDELLRHQDRVFEVVSAPRHEGDQNVPPQGQLPPVGTGPVGYHLSLFHFVPDLHDGNLVHTGILIGPLELGEVVDIRANLLGPFAGAVALDANDDAAGIYRVHDAGTSANHHRSAITGSDILHARSHDGCFGAEQRNRLPLHVGTHQRSVGIVVLQKRDERCCHRNQLFRRDVDTVHGLTRGENEVARLSAVHAIRHQPAVLIQLGVGLSDDVLVLLPGGQIESMRLPFPLAFAGLLQFVVIRFEGRALDDLPDREGAITAYRHQQMVYDAALLHPLIRTLYEAVLVDPRVAGQRADQPDVRTFRRLDRADSTVMGRVDVANLEACSLSGEPPRTQCRQPSLVGNLGERVGLVHELRQLGRAEELADRSHYRFGIDEVMRHGGCHLLIDAHLLFNGALHPNQTDSELVLQELTYRAHSTVAEVIDVIHRSHALLQLQEVLDDLEEILRRQQTLIEAALETQLGIELQPAHFGEVVLLRVDEHPLEQRAGALESWRISRPKPPVDLDERLLGALQRVLPDR